MGIYNVHEIACISTCKKNKFTCNQQANLEFTCKRKFKLHVSNSTFKKSEITCDRQAKDLLKYGIPGLPGPPPVVLRPVGARPAAGHRLQAAAPEAGGRLVGVRRLRRLGAMLINYARRVAEG